ncbi:MAG TPA: CoA-binding protein [Trueperaceae bacterium]
MTTSSRTSIRDLLEGSRTVAVLGASNRRGRPAYYVPDYLARNGFEVLPVNPNHLGETEWEKEFVASLAELDEPVDIVNVFRRPQDIPPHLDDILSLDPLPRAVWFQLGIRNDDAARKLEEAGIQVIQDRCILVEHRALD